MRSLRNIALAGNLLYILWIVYNGIDEGSQGIGAVQAIALSGLLVLLVLNLVLLWRPK